MSIFTKEFHPIRISKKSENVVGAILGFIFILGLPVFIFFSFIYPLFSNDESVPTQSKAYVPTEIELHVQAQQFVKQGLKAPSTAKFPLEPVSAGTDGNGLYQVESYVDSQNSFGAMVRSEWMVNMRLVGDKWILDKMRIGGKIVYDITQKE